MLHAVIVYTKDSKENQILRKQATFVQSDINITFTVVPVVPEITWTHTHRL